VLDSTVEELTEKPESGVYVSGLFTDAWRWDADRKVVADSLPGEPYASLPPMLFLPESYHKTPSNYHKVPMYRTTVRRGNISSLGASSNFIMAVEVPNDKNATYWTLKGAACICSLDY
jgi:dynein heavy chain